MAQVLTRRRCFDNASWTSPSVRPSIRAHIASATEDITCACMPQMAATTSSIAFLGARRCRWCRRTRNAITRAQSIRGAGGFMFGAAPLSGADPTDFRCDRDKRGSTQVPGGCRRLLLSGEDRFDELQIAKAGRPTLEPAQARRA